MESEPPHAAPDEREPELEFESPVLERAELVRSALDRNPDIAASREAWRAMLAREPQARALDDPMASYEVAPLSIGASDVDFGQVIAVRQALPYPGTLRIRGAIAQAEAAAADADHAAIRVQIGTLAALLFDDLWLIDRALEVNVEHERLLRELHRVATARYVAGEGGQEQPLQADVELAHIEHREVVLRADRAVTRARINALLHRSPKAELPQPVRERELGPALSPEWDFLPAHPDLRARSEMVRARERAVEATSLRRYPDFEVMSSYNSMWGEEEHRWMVGGGIRIPLWRERIEAEVGEARARLRMAERERESLADELLAGAAAARERVAEALHVDQLYRDRLLPAARDQLRAARASYETGRASFLTVIEAERNLRSVELGMYDARANVHRRRAELARALGLVPELGGRPTPSPVAVDSTVGFLEETGHGTH